MLRGRCTCRCCSAKAKTNDVTLRDYEVRHYQSQGVEIQWGPAVVENCLFHLDEGGAINFC